MSDDMLSQDEIDALLKGDDSASDEVEENVEGSEELEVEETLIEDVETTETNSLDLEDYSDVLTDLEIDALGEIGNISMGTAATTLSTLLDKKVNITTPSVEITTAEVLAQEYEAPLVAVDVSYSEGLEGSNIMMLKTDDVKIITDLMMGKEEVDTDRELTELDLSAVSEAMNQMMGSSATSLSSMLDKKIDIKPPKSEVITFSEGKKTIELLKNEGPLIKISFRMEIGEYIDSNIMQLVPVDFGKKMVETLMSGGVTVNNGSDDMGVEEVVKEQKPTPTAKVEQSQSQVQQPQAQPQQPRKTQPVQQQAPQEPVMVSKPQFPSFDSQQSVTNGSDIDLVGDIPVEITVELGRSSKKIGEILEFGMGTIIELDKLVGEPLKVLANGKYIASGEVVVIDDSFGVRITEIETDKKII